MTFCNLSINNRIMKLVVLGSGCAMPQAKRTSSAYWLDTDAGSLLLDISADAPSRMAQENLDWVSLDAIWVSHFHLDHLGGLAPFLFGLRAAPQSRERSKRLRICGAEGLKELFEKFAAANDKLLQHGFPIELIEVGADAEFEILPGLQAQTFSTPHTKESLALRLIDKGDVSLVYTSDTAYSDALASFAGGAHVLLVECSFPGDKPVTTHLNLAEAMQLAAACSPQRVILTHLYPAWDGLDIRALAKQLWQGEVLEAFDGLRLEF
jgi:ribonuclease BN (tRNA processing enzyme)